MSSNRMNPDREQFWKGHSTAYLVDRGLELRAFIAAIEGDLEHIEAELCRRAASAAQEPLKDEEREGRQWSAEGSEKIVPVILTADKIVQSLSPGNPALKRLLELAGAQMDAFYAPSTIWKIVPKTGKQFRAKAAELLGGRGPLFVAAALARDKFGTPISDIRVIWADAAPRQEDR